MRGLDDGADPMLIASYAPSFGSLADPPGSSVLIAAVSWLQGTLLGTVATTAAIIAVACVGFMMLSGRLSVRPGAAAILGSFILFGASTIVAGIQASLSASVPVAVSDVLPAMPPSRDTSIPATAALAAPLADNDPYAGASVPSR